MSEDQQEPPCECSQAGFCPRYRIQMNSYAHGICSGQGSPSAPCSPQKSQLYRSKWRKIAEERSKRVGLISASHTNLPLSNHSSPTKVAQPQRRQSQPKPTHGPGTELKELLASIGLTPQGCQCESRVKLMNQWGVEGCKTNREKIVSWLREEEKKRGWAEKLKASVLTVTTGLITQLSPTSPLESLVELAISKAEEKSRVQTRG